MAAIPSTTTSLATELERALLDLWVGLLRRTEGDLSRTAASVLNTLCEGPRRITELAVAQAVAQPTMTVAIQRLEARGLVTRHRDTADRRATNVAITDAGRETLARRRAARAALLAERLDSLSATDRDAIAQALPALQALTPDHA
jgi:DNA-binding MarR family transcriptional regulator